MKDINILIVDDLQPVVKRLVRILKKDDRIKSIRTAFSGSDAVKLVYEKEPDIILMDVNMETGTAGIDSTRIILKDFPHIKIIMLTVYEDEDTILNAFHAGVVNYLLKDATPRKF